MSDWDRIQRLELELAQQAARVRSLTEELDAQKRASIALIMAVEDQRDSARSIACRLEQELAEAERQLDELTLDELRSARG